MCKRVAERYYGNPYKNNFSFSKKTNLQLCCQHWKNSYSYAIEDGKYILNFMVARFEDFLIDPRNFLKEICDFVELEFDEKMVPASNQRSTYFGQMKSRWYPLRQDANSRYLNELTNDEIDIIKLNCGELIDKFGYQAPTRS
ncbi:MAG: sulfotransferase domain-containing protein [Bacteroidetes bacterium]|nr:sulfotransferase domain-containing protein [Bacteroidota bacterium]